MKSNKERLFATSLLAGVASLGLPMLAGGVAMMSATDATAQDYTSGSLVGHVESQDGTPVAGAQVSITSDRQGFTRTTTTDSDGDFIVPVIPLGGYTVTINASGFQTTQSESVTVRPSTQSAYTFAMAPLGTSSDEIVVTAARQVLAFNRSTTGLQIDVEELASRIPVGQSALALTLLAPTAIQGGASNRNAAFAGQPSIGGASVAENAFYINGLNITNFDNYLGASLVPFQFYQTIDVGTGGYPAEFGRATGGVVNAVSKSGSNDFMMRLSGAYDSPDLQEQQPRTLNDANEYDRTVRQLNTLEIGGPVWRDHLFFYGMMQTRDVKNEFASLTGGSYNIERSDDPFYAAKIDFNVTDTQRLEFTWFDTTRETLRETHPFAASPGEGGTINYSPGAASYINFAEGGESYVARYTGAFTDWFTLSAAYGVNEDTDSTLPTDTTSPFVSDTRQGTLTVSTQKASALEVVFRERVFYRVDADFYFNLLGDHHVKMGWDNEDLTLTHNTLTTGGERFSYLEAVVDDPYGQPAGSDYIQRQIFTSGGTFKQTNEAYYIQDEWEPVQGLTLNLGVRLDTFNAANADDIVFAEFDSEIGPRLGFSWDPSDDGESRFFGSYGRYYLPVAANTSYRMGGAELYISEYFQVTDVGADNNPANDYDPVTGLPIGGLGPQILENAADWASICPAGTTSPGADACEVTGDGVASVPTTLVATNLESTFEDEVIVGYEHRFDDWTLGVTGEYRSLGRIAEDSAIDAAVLAYCTENAIAGCEDVWTGFHQYVILNPGLDAEVVLDAPGHPLDLQTITIPASDAGYPQPKREYFALTVDFEREWDGQWMLQGSYTAALSEGNYEGQAKSDNGQDDVGITTDFDQPGLTDGSYGLLPNHRAHQFKVFGAYALTDDLTIGANAVVVSPRQFGCIGRHRTDPFAPLYGAASWFCSPDGTAGNSVSTPRGTVSESDWLTQLDLQFVYTVPNFGQFDLPGDLSFRAEIFNVFNQQNVLSVEERGENTNGTVRNLPSVFGAGIPAYGFPTSYQQARFVRLGFSWEF